MRSRSSLPPPRAREKLAALSARSPGRGLQGVLTTYPIAESTMEPVKCAALSGPHQGSDEGGSAQAMRDMNIVKHSKT